jgi:two-component system, NtrC family, response regulator
MPLSLQKVFLRVLQERRFRPIGSSREIESNFRLVAATNRNLQQMAEERHLSFGPAIQDEHLCA